MLDLVGNHEVRFSINAANLSLILVIIPQMHRLPRDTIIELPYKDSEVKRASIKDSDRPGRPQPDQGLHCILTGKLMIRATITLHSIGL